MEKICNNCKRFMTIENTEESRQGICSFGNNYMPVNIDNTCVYLPKEELTCGDCDRYENDTACITVDKDDLVNDCSGYIDKDIITIKCILSKWAVQNIDYCKKMYDILKEFAEEFEYPFEAK